MTSTTSGRHLSDAELIRAIEYDPGHADPRRHHRHLADCRQCADAVASLRTDRRLVSEWLDRAAFEADLAPADLAPTGPASTGPAPAGPASASTSGARSFVPWLRAAAILVLLAAPLAALPSVRSWVAERVTGPSTNAAPAAVEAEAEPTVLRFVPEPGELVVRFDPEARGLVSLDRAPGNEAVLRASGGAPEAVVSASSLQIRNAGPGRYHLRLPAATSAVRVLIGERGVAVSEAQLDRGTLVRLERP